ncbi:MAG: hypothetical protein ETSY1_00500 [Candidatus Entotheonella factor]|uniref:AsmA domain-containing protein n=1 Tax=Entotheonella factor TaxID=1429438 RepID=W4LZH5_ENTF1|nr:AsmA family protein [Candidatus Entotheonella palauensis]ETX03325.1 MAG: hypothetical protein ETSY1_00500 [Candidatus Entotheonella factor]
MRWLLVILIGLVALIVLALAFAPSLLNLEQVKERIVNRVEQQLNRDVELGQVRLEFFNGLGAGLDNLTIANPKGWQSPHFVKVETLSVKVALRPLLSRKIEVSKIILSTGEIVVERDAQGHFNYDDLTAAPADGDAASETAKPPSSDTPEAAGSPDGPSPLAGLLVSKLALNQVDVKFIDQMVVAGQTVTTAARQVNLEADNIGFNTPIMLDLSGALLTDGEANVRLNGRIGPVPNQANIDLQQIPLQLTLKATALQLAPVVPYLGEQPALTAGALETDLTIEGTLGKALDINGQLALNQAVMPDATGQGPPTTLPAVTLTQDLTVDLASALLTITKAQADLGALQTTLAGTVKQFDTPSPQLDLSLNTSNVAIADVMQQWPMLASALPDAMEAKGNIALQATVKGSLERLQTTSQLNAQPLSVRLSDGTDLNLAKVQLAQDALLDMGESMVTLNQFDLDVGFLQATAAGTIANFDSAPNLDLQVETSNFAPATVLTQLPMLAEALPQPAEVQGDLQLRATLQGTLDNLNTDAHLTAQALALKSGSFHGGPAAHGGMRIGFTNLQTHLKTQLNASTLPTVNMDLNAKHFVFDQQAATAPETTPAPGASSPTSTSTAPPINVQGNIALASGQVTGIDFQNLKAAFSILDGRVKSQQSMQLFGGTYEGSLTANVAQAKPDYQLALKLANMQAGDMANTLTSAPNILIGLLNTNLKFSGKGFDWSDISTTLTGTGALNLNNFKLTTLDVMPKLAKSLSAASTIAGFTVPDNLSTRSFDKLKANIRFKDGKVHSEDLKLWGPDVQLLGEGLLGLDRSLAFDGTVVLLGKLAKSLGKRAKFLLDQKGNINIPLAIEGTVTQPRIKLNETHLADLAQRALTQQLEDKAGKEVKKLIEKVLPGATTSGKSGDRAEPVPEPLKGLDKAIKGLFNR